MPPRRPTIRQSRPCRTTWTPRRASQPRSSKPSSGPRGAATVARSSSTAPWGGERPSGSSSSTRSRSERSSKRRTSAGSRSANVDLRTGPVTTAVTAAERPISGTSTLRVERVEPQRSPTTSRRAAAPARRPAAARSGVAPPRARRRDEHRARRPPARESRSRARDRGTPRARGVSARRVRSGRHHVPQLLDARGADARDRVEIVDRAKAAVLGAVVEDLLGGDRADPGKRVELGRGGRAEADAAAGGLARLAPGPVSARAPASRRRAAPRG